VYNTVDKKADPNVRAANKNPLLLGATMPETDTMTIEDEILEATKEKPQGKKEDRQAYLERLVLATSDGEKFSDDQWNALREDPTQKWCTAGANAYRDKKDIPDFPDEEALEVLDEEIIEEPEVLEEPEPKPTARRGRPAKEKPAEEVIDELAEDAPPLDETIEEEPEEKPVAPKPSTRPSVRRAEPEEEKPIARKTVARPVVEKPAAVEPEQPKKPSAGKFMQRLICKYPEAKKETILATVRKNNFEITEASANTLWYGTHNTITILKELGWTAPKTK